MLHNHLIIDDRVCLPPEWTGTVKGGREGRRIGGEKGGKGECKGEKNALVAMTPDEQNV